MSELKFGFAAPEESNNMGRNLGLNLSLLRRLNSFAPFTSAALIGLAGVGLGDNNILAPVRVDGDSRNDAPKLATQSYKYCWSAMRLVNGMKEDRFFAEPIVEAKGHKLAPADTTLTIQSQNGPINIPISRDGAVENFPISNLLLAENPLIVANQPKGTLDLALQIRIPIPNQKRFRYSELVAGLKESNHLFRKALGIFALLAPQTRDLTFVFRLRQAYGATGFASSGNDRPQVTVLWNGSPETKVADGDGMLTLQVNESSKENPEVLLSEIPEKILAIPQR
jgi:hypothetical protein